MYKKKLKTIILEEIYAVLKEQEVIPLPDDPSPRRTIPTDDDKKRSEEEAKKDFERRRREEEIRKIKEQAQAIILATRRAKLAFNTEKGVPEIRAPDKFHPSLRFDQLKPAEQTLFKAYERLNELEKSGHGYSPEADFLRNQIQILEDPSGGLKVLDAFETFNGIFGGVAALTRTNRGSGWQQYKNPNYNPRPAMKQDTVGAYKPPAPPIINTPTSLINNFTKLTMEPLERAEKVGNVQDQYGNNKKVVKFPKGVKVYSALYAEIKNPEDVDFTPRMSKQSKNRKGKETVGLYATEFPNADRYFPSFADKLYEIEISPNAKIADLRRPGYNDAGEYIPDMSGWSAGRVSPREQQHWLSNGITALIGNDIAIGTQIVFLDPSAIISITKIKEMPKK